MCFAKAKPPAAMQNIAILPPSNPALECFRHLSLVIDVILMHIHINIHLAEL